MSPELKLIIFEEKKALQELLELLDKQYREISSKELLELEKINSDIEAIGKSIAAIEIKRRNIVKDDDFKEIIKSCEDNHIKDWYEEIKIIIKSLQSQKDINCTLIKQDLFFTNKIIDIISPSKSIGTYNSYGKVGR